MDSRAKQRLTGAVILVALFVLLVPELLTGPRVPDTHEGAPTDEGMHRYTIDLDASAPRAQPDNAAAQAPVALPPVADNRAQPGEAAAPAAPVATEPAAPDTAAARAEPQKPPVPSQPVPTQSAPTQPAPTQSAVTPAPTQAPLAAGRGSFVVQLGTFGSRENADNLVRDMSAKGFAAFISPYAKEGHELYRVRVGPTRDRAAAEALAAQLRRVGQPSSIVPIS
jgi:DedD protein